VDHANDLDGVHLAQQRNQRAAVQPAGAQHQDAGPACSFVSFSHNDLQFSRKTAICIN